MKLIFILDREDLDKSHKFLEITMKKGIHIIIEDFEINSDFPHNDAHNNEKKNLEKYHTSWRPETETEMNMKEKMRKTFIARNKRIHKNLRDLGDEDDDGDKFSLQMNEILIGRG